MHNNHWRAEKLGADEGGFQGRWVKIIQDDEMYQLHDCEYFMNANEDDEDKDIDSATISLFILFLYHTSDLRNRESDTIPNNKSNYETSRLVYDVRHHKKTQISKMQTISLFLLQNKSD